MVLGQQSCNNVDDVTMVMMMTAMIADLRPGDCCQRIAFRQVCSTRVVIVVVVVVNFVIFVIVVC